ncbi:hypothetical protein DAEQUDRAFT_726059 [Daedalea quercina L-15889]|uniref:Uncharacterized protein n=1 Tax=Daedalea quercina L-15889 TaxID=1314783 RepID=A0A165QPJ1_9APHY|nr:hypothetical protein DAEQUDRAFT_726059 [Daedalea quercina L-15889]
MSRTDSPHHPRPSRLRRSSPTLEKKTNKQMYLPPSPILMPIDELAEDMGLYMAAHRVKNDRTVALYLRMEEHYTAAIAHCDSWLRVHRKEHGVPTKLDRHSSSWRQHRADLDDALARLRDAGVTTYDPSRGPPLPGSLAPNSMSDARQARLHWLALQPEQRDEAAFTRYEVDSRKAAYTKQLLVLKKAEELHWQAMRLLLRARVKAARRRGLRNLRCVVCLNRTPYAVFQDREREQKDSMRRRRTWRRVGKTVIWLQKANHMTREPESRSDSGIDA